MIRIRLRPGQRRVAAIANASGPLKMGVEQPQLQYNSAATKRWTGTRTVFFVLMSALAMVSTFFSGQALYSERERIASGYGDFIIYYTGAQIVREGAGRDLYDLARQRLYQDQFRVPIRIDVLPFNHPAYELLWHVPLTYLGYFNAYLVWLATNVGLLLVFAPWFAPRDSFHLRLMSWLMLFGFFPVLTVFLHGQDSILLLFLIAASAVALKGQNPIAAGVLLGLASFKPQVVLPIALAWTCKPYRKAAAAWFVTVALLGVVSISMVGIAGAVKYLQLLSWIDQVSYTINPTMMPNLRGIVHLVLAARFPAAVLPLTGLLSLAVVAYLFYIWRSAPVETHEEFDLVIGLTVTLAVLASYHAYTHDFVLLLLPSLVVARSVLCGGLGGALAVSLLGILLVFWIPFPFSYGLLLQAEKLAWITPLVIVFAGLQAWHLNFLRARRAVLQRGSVESNPGGTYASG